MDGPQGPHQPSSTSWMYMQHLLQQLQDHQQPQQPQPQQPSQQQQQQPPPPPHQHQLPPHQPTHQQHTPPPPPPPTSTPPLHLHHHHHHQPLPQQQQQQQQQQHHQPIQMQHLPPPPPSPQQHQQQQQQPQPQQYQQHIQHHQPQHQPQHRYKPIAPAPAPHQSNKSFIRSDDHSYSVESLLAAGPRGVDIAQPPLHPAPIHPAPVHPAPVHPVHPVQPVPITPKVQPDNEMMVMSFLNELEGGKKIQANNCPPPPQSNKTLPTSETSSFSQVLVRDPNARVNTGLIQQDQQQQQQPPPHLRAHTPMGLPGDAARLNHNGESASLSVRPPNAPIMMSEPMNLNSVYPSSCEGNGVPMSRLERGDSASSMSQLDLGLSDDSNPLIDQLESALESDCSLQAKTSPECPVAGDASSCSRDDAEGTRDAPPQPQTEMFMSLLNNPASSSSSSSDNNKDVQPPTPPQQNPESDAPPQASQDKDVDSGAQEQDTEKEIGNDDEDNDDDDDDQTPQIAITDVSSLSNKQDTQKDADADTDEATPKDTHQTEETKDVPESTDGNTDAAEVNETQDATISTKSPEPNEECTKDPNATPSKDTPPPPPPPEGIDESSDVELEGETIAEEPDQEPEKSPAEEQPSPKRKLRIRLNCIDKSKITETPEPSDNPDSPPPIIIQDVTSGENSMDDELPASTNTEPKQSEKVVDIPAVYIIEPKKEKGFDAPPKNPAEETIPEIICDDEQDDEPKKTSKKVPPMKIKKSAKWKDNNFFENTTVPPGMDKVSVMCFVCDTSVKVNKFKHHLFFGFVRCHYCNRRLMGCKLLKEDLNNPDKSICFSSPSKDHSFSKWASDPIEHLSYYIRKDLVIKRFCAGKTKPPPVPEIVEEIHTYISKLSPLENFGPWCYAFERCHKYIRERVSAEPKAFSSELINSFACPLTITTTAQSSTVSSTPTVTTTTANQASTPTTPTPPPPSNVTILTPVISQTCTLKDSTPKPGPSTTPSQPVAKPPVTTQSDNNPDDPMELGDDHISDAVDSPASTTQTVKVRDIATLSEASRASSRSSLRLDHQTVEKPETTTPTISRVSSPARSLRTSKTPTPEIVSNAPIVQSDVETLDASAIPPGRPTSAGTTLIRQWGTKNKIRTHSTRRSQQADSFSVNENYLMVKYPSEPCPDVCPSCYTTFDPLHATVQCSSFLMTVKCESCSLTLFVSQDPPPIRPRKKRRL